MPYIGLRLFPALCGALVPVLCFLTLKEIGVSKSGSLFGAILTIFDNALITQSRLILLDSMLMAACCFTVFSYIKFYKTRHQPFSFDWYLWIITTGVSISLVMGVKMVGLFTVLTLGVGTFFELWDILDIKRGHTFGYFLKHLRERATYLIALPFTLYLAMFYIHFLILCNSGPGDAFMSTEFQTGLVGNPLTMSSVPVFYGANVTIKHVPLSVYLHSHVDRYPLRYEDDRVSSQGQQVVSCLS